MRELSTLSAFEVRDLIRARVVSPVDVTEHFLARIEEHDRTLGSFVTLDVEGAREQARRAERGVLDGDATGLLHGVPISVKENIPVAGLPTTGLGGRGGEVPGNDWIGIERLRSAGAVVVGTNTVYAPTARLQARNPWDLARSPGASSSGSGSAVAAGLIAVAIAGDGAGSTRLPGAFCGVVGLHPTRGRVPHVDYAYPSLGFGFTIGPLARDVRDVAVVFQTIAGPDFRDIACVESEPEDCLGRLDAGVEGLRFAWTEDFGYGAAYAVEESPRVVAAVREAAARYRQLGATVTGTEVTLDDPAPFFWTTFGAAGVGWPGQTPPSFPPAADYRSALEARARTIDRLRGVFERHDLLLCPTVQAVAPPADVFAERWANIDPLSDAPSSQHYLCFTMMFNWIGWPALTLPCGTIDGLPVGLQIVGPPCSEALILRAARAFQAMHEQGTPAGFA